MKPPRTSRWATYTALCTVFLVALSLGAGRTAEASSAAETPTAGKRPAASTIRQLPVNGRFARGASGWSGRQVSLDVRQGQSQHVLRAVVKPAATSAGVFRPRAVATSQAGKVYRASAWVRSVRPGQRLCLRLTGSAGASIVGGAETCLRAGTQWRQARLSYHPRPGLQLRVALSSDAPRRGDRFEVRSLTITVQTEPTRSVTGSSKGCRGAGVKACPAASTPTTTTTPPTTPPTTTTTTTTATTTTTTTTTPAPTPPPPAPSTSSPIRQLVGPGPFGTSTPLWSDATAWQSDSSTYANRLRSVVTQAVLTVSSYGVAVSFASSSDPLTTVVNTNGWGTVPGTTSLRVPAAAKPASGTDGHLVVVQPDGTAVEMWKAVRQSNGSFTAGSVTRSFAGQYGFAVGGCRGSSFALAAGAIDPAEVKAGRIDHALLVILPSAAVRRAAVFPSTATDGTNYLADSLPEGARLVLDPGADLSGLSPVERTIAVALQRYGAYVGDKTSGTDMAFVGIAPETYTALGQADPWAAQGLTGYPDLRNLMPLLSKLKVATFTGFKLF